MTPMLRLVARAYATEYRHNLDELSQTVFVFPNKRSATFFLRYLDLELASPHIEPEVITIADLVASLSTLAEAPRFMQLATLYDAYRQIAPMGIPDFDRFLFWGETILADYADVDRHLVDPESLFTNVKELKEINSTYLTDLQREIIRQYWGVEPGGINAFLYGEGSDNEAERFWTHLIDKGDCSGFRRLWEILAQLYTRFHAMLEEDGYATSGRHYREAAMRLKEASAEDFPLTAPRYVFVGFNQLSPAEFVIFKSLQQIGRADFYWDVASPLFEGEARRTAANPLQGSTVFPSRLTLDEEPPTIPDIEVIGVASAVGQTKVAASKLAQWQAEGVIGDGREDATGIDTAVVLADEALLIPALNHLPPEIETVNITMGFPMKLTPLAAVMHAAVALQHRLRNDETGRPVFFYEDVQRILTQPVVRSIDPERIDLLLRDIKERRLFTLAPEFIAEAVPSLAPMFAPIAVDRRGSLDDALRYFDGLIALFARYALRDGHEAERRFLESYSEALASLAAAFRRRNVAMLETTMASLIERAVASETVRLTGKPLEGVQVMGMLETRSLDFDNIIITSMNESVFPRRHSRPSFIPEALRHAFHLPGKDAVEKDYGYYFYRLITRARRVTLLYDARKGSGRIGSGEMSRYIAQLIYLLPPGHLRHSTASFSALTAPEPTRLSIAKTPEVMELLNRFRDPDSGKNLSASALNNYITCPLLFYLQNVRGLNFPSETDGDDTVDSSTFGSILHDVAENLYTALASQTPDGTITEQTLREVASRRHPLKVQPLVTSAINRIHLHRVDRKDVEGGKAIPLRGLNAVMGNLIEEIILNMLRVEADTNGPVRFVAAEKDIRGRLELAPGITVNIRQIIDRVDAMTLPDGTEGLRFIDYKTGRDSIAFESLDAAFDPDARDRPKVLLQLLFYCLCYAGIEGYDGPIQPFVYKPKALFKEPLQAPYFKAASRKEKGETITDWRDLADRFRSRLSALVTEIFDPDTPFEAATSRPGHNGHGCRYCSFKPVCGVS